MKVCTGPNPFQYICYRKMLLKKIARKVMRFACCFLIFAKAWHKNIMIRLATTCVWYHVRSTAIVLTPSLRTSSTGSQKNSPKLGGVLSQNPNNSFHNTKSNIWVPLVNEISLSLSISMALAVARWFSGCSGGSGDVPLIGTRIGRGQLAKHSGEVGLCYWESPIIFTERGSVGAGFWPNSPNIWFLLGKGVLLEMF